MKLAAIDFEYNGVTEKKLNLICCSIAAEGETESYWLKGGEQTEALKEKLLSMKDDHIFICHSGEAEGSSFISLGLDPFDFKVIDTLVEYGMLLNHCAEYMYGAQYVDGKVVFLKPPYKLLPGESSGGKKASKSLASACFKVLGKKIDTDHKNYVRSIIIENKLVGKHRDIIIEYCESDVTYLIDLFKKIASTHMQKQGIDKETYTKEALLRGERTFAVTAYIVRKGYPINYEGLRNFSTRVPEIKNSAKEKAAVEVLNTEGFSPYRYHMKERKWKTNLKAIRTWIANSRLKNKWAKTEKGMYSIATEELERFCSDRHSYSNGLLSQLLKVARIDTSVSSMSPTPTKKGGKTLWDYVGSDKRVRPFLNPFGSQSGRWQPSSTSFLLLKTAWIRSAFHPPKDNVVVAIDYSQQEFLLGAVLSGDKAMMDAYLSGDTYLHSAKKAKAVPEDATKESHPLERSAFKAIVLGIGFGKTEHGLAVDLEDFLLRKCNKVFKSNTEKEEWLLEAAREYLDTYKSLYPTYFSWVENSVNKYKKNKFRKLPRGWTMYEDNRNERSVGNFGVQGSGAEILHDALARSIRYGIKEMNDSLAVAPLHDAGYWEVPYDKLEQVLPKLNYFMQEAYLSWVDDLPNISREEVPLIRTDVEVWGDAFGYLGEDKDVHKICDGVYSKKTEIGGVDCLVANIHADERMDVNDFLTWTKYFDKKEDELEF